ncbi:MAG TPA: hypothetical protein PKB11_04610 [Desulfovibrio sp.]|jgi:hypothetical protein|uniref:hypothetical protein n=1 Tax=Desulfovibrio TaxID=872 RepID=UPI00041023A5|nr:MULTISPECIES: hypothetical protein [Desulfovibrio]HMM38018.1 hypothetical protein [Desulfovibrio sp.]
MRKLLIVLTHRWAIAAANVVVVLMALQGTWDIIGHFKFLETHQEAIELGLDGLGTIFVAFGVALEEREGLMRFLGLYPARFTPQEHFVDEQCHYHGLSILLVGLFMEVLVFLIRMPDLNTVDFDPALLIGATVLNVGGAILLVRLSWLLARPKDAEAA